nr:MAG TPA_asm: hypothetical protein [Caudoviricetes sp.]
MCYKHIKILQSVYIEYIGIIIHKIRLYRFIAPRGLF